jgi:HEAT repeat protein
MNKNSLLAVCLAGGFWLALPATTVAAVETTQELVGVLESDASVEEKAIACRKLGEFGTAEAVPALASLLDDEVLSTYARAGLERIPDPSASAALRAALETTEGVLLVGLIDSLGVLQDEKAVPALSELAGGDDIVVSDAALRALGRVANPEAVQVVKTALASGRAGAAAACLLAAEQQRARGHNDVAITLYDAVSSADVSRASRMGAIRGAIVTRDSVPFLVEQLKSDDAATRAVALTTVREMPSPELADALHTLLASAGPDLRVQLITALRDCHNADSFGVVRSQLDSDTQATRVAALGVVSSVGSGAELATTLLDVVQRRPSPQERQTAMELLTRMEGGQEVDRVILDRLRETEAADARIDVIRILGNRRAPSAVGDLLGQAGDEDAKIRVAALRSMRRLVGPNEVAALINLTRAEQDNAARLAAISALVSACGDDAASGALVLTELNQASDPSQKDTWTRVLTTTGYPKALPTILEDLKSPDQDVVAATVTHLSRWPDPTPIDALFPLVGTDADSPVQRRAVSAVIQLTTTAADRGQRPDDVVTGWFGQANAAVVTVEEKRQLISGLARVHTLDSLVLLEPYLEDPEVKTEALYALLSIGSPLVRAGQHAAVRKALPEASSIEEQELTWRIGRLRRQVEAADSPQ